MTTTSHNRTRCRSRTIVGVLIAAGVTALGLLGTPAPAYAADQYIAVALGYISENPPVTMAGGSAISANRDQAGLQAQSNCSSNGGGHCVTMAISTNECAAAASNNFGEETGASAPTLAAAQSKALSQLQNQQGAKVIVSGCANGSTPPPAPPSQPTPPPPPKQGPTVTFNTVIGGLESHITDRSGVTSQCTYVTDNVNRSFGLQANSTYDLRIVPAVPQFRNWTVTVKCDNGTTTTATTFF